MPLGQSCHLPQATSPPPGGVSPLKRGPIRQGCVPSMPAFPPQGRGWVPPHASPPSHGGLQSRKATWVSQASEGGQEATSPVGGSSFPAGQSGQSQAGGAGAGRASWPWDGCWWSPGPGRSGRTLQSHGWGFRRPQEPPDPPCAASWPGQELGPSREHPQPSVGRRGGAEVGGCGGRAETHPQRRDCSHPGTGSPTTSLRPSLCGTESRGLHGQRGPGRGPQTQGRHSQLQSQAWGQRHILTRGPVGAGRALGAG